MSITLPPLPEPPAWMDDEGDVFARPETPEMALSLPTMLYTTDQLRARDLEVARLVLEAAKQEHDGCIEAMQLNDRGIGERILALEFRHHE